MQWDGLLREGVLFSEAIEHDILILVGYRWL